MSHVDAFNRNLWSRRRSLRAISEAASDAAPCPTTIAEDSSYDITRMPFSKRLRIIEDFVATHPGRPITPILLDIFPELLRIERGAPQKRDDPSG